MHPTILMLAILAALLTAVALVVPRLGWIGKLLSRYNARNIVVRWPITLMLLAAFTLQVGIVVVMLSFVRGLQYLTAGSSVPGNVIVLSEGATDDLFSNLGYRDSSDAERHPLVLRDQDDPDSKPLASWEVYVVVNQPLPLPIINGRRLGCRFTGESLELASVSSSGPLAAAGLKAGDTISRWASRPIESQDDLRMVLSGRQAGKVPVDFSRAGTAASSMVNLDYLNKLERARRFLQVRGIDDPGRSLRVHNMKLVAGQTFSQAGVRPIGEGDQRRTAVEAILGEGIARTLASDLDKATLEPGDLFSLGDSTQPFIVAGIMGSQGSTFDSEIWAKHSLVGRKFGKDSYSTIVLRTAGATEAAELAKDLTDNFKKAALRARTETDYYESLNQTNQQFLVAILFVAVVVGIGGILGLMNTMFAAISQRIKDIGVLRILGYSGFQVMTAFLFEALLLAIVGGLLGCAAGSLGDGFTASSIISSGAGGGKNVVLRMTVDGTILMAGMATAFIMGLLGGLLPAINSTFIKPLEALR
ncbi:MAG: ABC transporter permease [Planctomycetota bacterium]